MSLVATSGSFGRRVSGSGFWDTGVGIRVSGLGEELQSHKTDLNYLRLRLEDLTENTPTKNTSMGTLFQFLLDRPTPLVLPSSVQVALAAAMKIEERGSQSRRHLAKVLAKKKKKCVAISKCQSALGYFPNACQDPSAIASK